MGNNFDANLPELTASADPYGDVGDDAYRIPANVNDKTGDPDTIAGDDQYGALFASRIAPAIVGAAQLSHGIGDGLHNTSKLIVTTAALYNKADQVNAEQAGNLANHTINP